MSKHYLTFGCESWKELRESLRVWVDWRKTKKKSLSLCLIKIHLADICGFAPGGKGGGRKISLGFLHLYKCFTSILSLSLPTGFFIRHLFFLVPLSLSFPSFPSFSSVQSVGVGVGHLSRPLPCSASLCQLGWFCCSGQGGDRRGQLAL